jgi:hypothetical protein
VIDPAHPLYGRRFPVRHVTRAPGSPGFVLVVYRETLTLRIPLPATSLGTGLFSRICTKWTTEALREVLALLKEVPPSCANRPDPCGENSPAN